MLPVRSTVLTTSSIRSEMVVLLEMLPSRLTISATSDTYCRFRDVPRTTWGDLPSG